MLRILIVDDESAHRLGMSHAIRTLKPRCLLFTAGDGAQALELLSRFEMDLVLTDIRMPNVDGMELIERAKKAGCAAYFVILSGYGEFEYAQKAIALGVDGYLLKPTDPGELLTLLDDMEKRLLEKRTRDQAQSRRMNEIERMLGDSIERRFEQFLLGHLDEEGMRDVRALLPEAEAGFVVCVHPEADAWTGADSDEWKAEIYRFFKPWGRVLSFRCMRLDGAMVTLFLSDDLPCDVFYANLVAFRELFSARGVASRNRFVVGVSEHAPMLARNAAEAFQHASDACEMAFYRPGETIYVYSEETALNAGLRGSLDLCAAEAAARLAQGDGERAADALLAAADAFFATHRPYPSRFKELLLLGFSVVAGEFRDAAEPEALRALVARTEARIGAAATADELRRAVRAACLECGALVAKRRASINEEVIGRAIKLLETEYEHNWTLKELAERCHFNASYFSTLFKQHTGVGYLDYLTNVRLDRAARLLLESDMRINRLSARVGYPNTAYFIRLFRERHGLTPSEYRRTRRI